MERHKFTKTYEEHWKEVHPSKKGYIPRARHGHRAVAINGSMFVFGGGDFKCFGECFVYKPEGNKWYLIEPTGQVPCPRASFGLETDGKQIFLFGGTDGATSLGDLYILDVDKVEWTCIETDSPIIPRPCFACSLTFFEGRFYLFGGIYIKRNKKRERFLDDLFVLEREESEHVKYRWIEVQTHGKSPIARESHTVVSFKTSKGAGKLLVYGGADEWGFRLPDMYLFDIATSTWSKPEVEGRPPYPRSMHTATIINNRMFIFGGWVPEVCDVSAARDGHLVLHQTQSRVSSNGLAVLNLSCVDIENKKLEWEYITENVVVTDDSYPQSRAHHSAVYLNSRIYIWAGRAGKLLDKSSLRCRSDLWYLELQKPDVPKNLRLTNLEHQGFEVYWDFVGNAQFYHVQILLPNSNEFKPIESTIDEEIESKEKSINLSTESSNLPQDKKGESSTLPEEKGETSFPPEKKVKTSILEKKKKSEIEAMEVDKVIDVPKKLEKSNESTSISEITKNIKESVKLKKEKQNGKSSTKPKVKEAKEESRKNSKTRDKDETKSKSNEPKKSVSKSSLQRNTSQKIQSKDYEKTKTRTKSPLKKSDYIIENPKTKASKMSHPSCSRTKSTSDKQSKTIDHKTQPSKNASTSKSTKQPSETTSSEQTKANQAERSYKLNIPQSDGPVDEEEKEEEIQPGPTTFDYLTTFLSRQREHIQTKEEKYFEKTLTKERIFALSKKLYSNVYSNIWYDVGYFNSNRAFVTYFLQSDRDGVELVYPLEEKTLPPGIYARHMQAIEEGATYYLRVAAVNSLGISEWSQVLTGIKTITSKLPLAPVDIKMWVRSKPENRAGLYFGWNKSKLEKTEILEYVVHLPIKESHIRNNEEVSLKLYSGPLLVCFIPTILLERLPVTKEKSLSEEIKIRIAARNQNGYGPYSQFIFQALAPVGQSSEEEKTIDRLDAMLRSDYLQDDLEDCIKQIKDLN